MWSRVADIGIGSALSGTLEGFIVGKNKIDPSKNIQE
jgi:hypothetical protein